MCGANLVRHEAFKTTTTQWYRKMAKRNDLQWKEAVIRVLREHGLAMHYTDIAETILQKGYRKSVGATPAATVSVALNKSIKEEGVNSPFLRVAKGEYVLRELAGQVEQESVGDETADVSTESNAGLIKAFGMFWNRGHVLWNSKPRLLGIQQEGADPVDFAGQYGVYLLHDGREVVYVGRTTERRLGIRLCDHTKDRLSGRWDRFSWFGLALVTDKGKLQENPTTGAQAEDIIVSLEAVLIEGLEPRQNRRRGDNFRASEYLQMKDPELKKQEKKRLVEELIEKL